MSVLIYSPMFGLREMDMEPSTSVPGTYVRRSVPTVGPGNWSTTWRKQWQVLIRTKDHHGRNKNLLWKDVPIEQLPAVMKTEALLQGIAL